VNKPIVLSLIAILGVALVLVALWFTFPRVPAVGHLAPAEAASVLGKSGLRLGQVSEEQESLERAGKVASQNPAAGTRVLVATPVNVTVYSRPATVTVPSVVGSLVDDVKGLLTDAGVRASAPATGWVVTSQDPKAGTSAPYGATITVRTMPWAHSRTGTLKKEFLAVHGAMVLRYGFSRAMADCVGQCHSTQNLCTLRAGCHSVTSFEQLLGPAYRVR
jgi:hypothetical protein